MLFHVLGLGMKGLIYYNFLSQVLTIGIKGLKYKNFYLLV